LEGRTPVEVAGINLNVNNGWGDLIEQATRYEAIRENATISQCLNNHNL
jgi:hypothetical protein